MEAQGSRLRGLLGIASVGVHLECISLFSMFNTESWSVGIDLLHVGFRIIAIQKSQILNNYNKQQFV